MASGQRDSRVLLALVAGLVIGIIVGATGSVGGFRVLHAIAPIGTLWINAVRMTVVPLVVALLFTSIVGTERTNVVGRELIVAASTFIGILLFSAFLAWLLAPALIADMK